MPKLTLRRSPRPARTTLYVLLGLLLLGQVTGLTGFLPESEECYGLCQESEAGAEEGCAPVCSYCPTCIAARVFVPSQGLALVPPAPTQRLLANSEAMPASVHPREISHVPRPAL
jgi:hypothetical protein